MDIEIAKCSCALKSCKWHETNLKCGRLLSKEAAAVLRFEKEKYENYDLGLCNDCYASHKALGLVRPA